MGATELRRLGLVRKPAIVVPNHMLEQFAREWLQLYPQARVLVARREDLQADRRRQFVARCATGDWDAVIMSRSAFERIPLSADDQRRYLDAELDQMRDWIQKSQGRRRADRQAAGRRAAARRGTAAGPSSTPPRTPGSRSRPPGSTTCSSTRRTATRTCAPPPTSPTPPSTAPCAPADLDMKIGYLRRRNGSGSSRSPPRPRSPTRVTEAYVMQRYLRPDLLEAAGIDVIRHLGGHLRPGRHPGRAGPRRRRQLPAEDPVRQVPQRPGDAPRCGTSSPTSRPPTTSTCPSPPSPQRPARRAARARRPSPPQPSDELARPTSPTSASGPTRSATGRSAPKKTTCSRSPATAAAPPWTCAWSACPGPCPARSRPPPPGSPGSGDAHRDDDYPAPDGTPYPVRGSLQLVFCDLGTPGDDWNVYDELRDQLAARGLPRGVGPVHPRGEDRPGQGRAVRRLPLRQRRRPGRLHREDGRRHQRPGPRRRPAPPRRPVAARRRRPARRPHRAPGQPQPRGPDPPLRHRAKLRRLHVADPGAQGPVHRPGHARPPGRPRDRRHRRHRAVASARSRPWPPATRCCMDKAEADAELARLDRAERAHHRNQDALRHTVTHTDQRITGLDPAHRRHRHRHRPPTRHPRRRVHHDRRRKHATPSEQTPAAPQGTPRPAVRRPCLERPAAARPRPANSAASRIAVDHRARRSAPPPSSSPSTAPPAPTSA